jgi:hypothetical protein
VKYNPENPDEGIVDSFMQKHFLSAIFFSYWVCFLLDRVCHRDHQ